MRTVRLQKAVRIWLAHSPRARRLVLAAFRRLVRLYELDVRRKPRYRAELELAFWLRPVSQTAIRQRLRCDELTALRLRTATTPTTARWGEQVTALAARLGVDRAALAGLLRDAGASAQWGEVKITGDQRDGER